MAKESPWFKFKVDRWNTGDIQMLPFTLKGVFADMMSAYWSKECKMTYKFAAHKYKAAHVDKLIESEVVKRNNDFIFIDFLDEQWAVRNKTANQNSGNGSKGAEARWGPKKAGADNGEKMATAISGDGEPMANKSESKRENERESEKAAAIPNTPLIEIFFTDLPNSTYFEQACRDLSRSTRCDAAETKAKLLPMITQFRRKCRTYYPKMSDFADHFKNWANKQLTTPGVGGSTVATGYRRGQKPIGG